MRAMFAGKFELRIAGSAGNDPRFHDAAQLDRRQADPAGSAEHRQIFFRAKARPMLERVICGPVGDGESRRAIEFETGWELHNTPARQGDAFGRGIEIAVTQDAVAGLEPSYTGAYAFNHACELAAWGERECRLRLVFSSNDQGVEEIQSRCFNSDDYLTRTRHRIGNIGEHEIVRRAE